MITRIKINGFKSLLDTELYLGPFTCIVGANAVGKSNFFDALIFLSNLADNTILQAAKSIRSDDTPYVNVLDIFFKAGEASYIREMSFEVDMMVPKEAEDDLGQIAKASITSLRYILELKFNGVVEDKQPIEIVKEELHAITQGHVKENIHFEYEKEWLDSVLNGRRSTANPFISTKENIIKLHSDSKEKKRGRRTTEFVAEKMPRTLLSTVTAESPTAFLVRHEMRNWSMLQFEPSALRQPNFIHEVQNAEITACGANLPATLYRLHKANKEQDVYQNLTNTVKGLVDNIDGIGVDKNQQRNLLTIQVRFKDGLTLSGQSLSDGTLRFLGLAVVEADNQRSGLICMEEPENGINPKKIETMVNLLKSVATDTEYEVDGDNSLRQVIINSHSPIVISAVPDESLYLSKEKEVYIEEIKRKVKCTGFSALRGTWRTDKELAEVTSLGEVIAYLDGNIAVHQSMFNDSPVEYLTKKKKRTVAENINQFKSG